jgi:N utilization substance protein A
VTVVDQELRSAQVIVPDFQLSLAIGREGQNARLAARLTGWKIDIIQPLSSKDRVKHD